MSQGRDGHRKERQEERKGGCRAPSTQEAGTTVEVGYAALSLGSVMPTRNDFRRLSSLSSFSPDEMGWLRTQNVM